MNQKICTGSIVKSRNEFTEDELAKFTTWKGMNPAYVDESIQPILATEGWLSTSDIDSVGDIIEPEGFRAHIPKFMKNPALMFNHDWGQLPLGIWTELTITDTGLYGKNLIFDTAIGRDVAMLIRAGVLRSYSVSFMPLKYEDRRDDHGHYIGMHFTDQEIIEGSVVSVPANINAVIAEAQAKKLNLEFITKPVESPAIRKGVQGMELKEVEKIAEEKALAAAKAVEDQSKVKAGEVQTEIANLTKLVNQIKDASASKETQAELKTLIEKVTSEFTAKTVELDKAIAERRAAKTVVLPGVDFQSTPIDKFLKMEPSELRGTLPKESAEQILKLQELHDTALLIDGILECASKQQGGNYHRQSRDARIKNLNIGKRYDAFYKAMDTATTAEGLQWIDSQVSGSFIESVKIQQKVANLFTVVQMPTPSFTIPVEGTDTLATLAGETTAIISGFNSSDQTPSSLNLTLTAHKARGHYQISTEMTEDAAFAILPMIREKLIRSLARAEENAILNGDNTSGSHFDSGYTVAATDFRKALDGLRYAWYVTINSSTAGSVAGKDLSTYNEANLRCLRGQMGKYGLYPGDLALMTSSKGYLLRLLSLDSYQTLEKIGPQAVVLSGQVAAFDGVPVIVTEFIDETQNASGIYDGSTVDKTSQILVHRGSWIRGIKRGVEILTERDASNDVYQLYAYNRVDFQPVITPASTAITVNAAYNIATV